MRQRSRKKLTNNYTIFRTHVRDSELGTFDLHVSAVSAIPSYCVTYVVSQGRRHKVSARGGGRIPTGGKDAGKSKPPTPLPISPPNFAHLILQILEK